MITNYFSSCKMVKILEIRHSAGILGVFMLLRSFHQSVTENKICIILKSSHFFWQFLRPHCLVISFLFTSPFWLAHKLPLLLSLKGPHSKPLVLFEVLHLFSQMSHFQTEGKGGHLEINQSDHNKKLDSFLFLCNDKFSQKKKEQSGR